MVIGDEKDIMISGRLEMLLRKKKRKKDTIKPSINNVHLTRVKSIALRTVLHFTVLYTTPMQCSTEYISLSQCIKLFCTGKCTGNMCKTGENGEW